MSSPGAGSPGHDLTCHARKTDHSTGTTKLCGRSTGGTSLLCKDHECIIDGCSRVRQESNPYCFVHKPAPRAFNDGEGLSRVTSR